MEDAVNYSRDLDRFSSLKLIRIKENSRKLYFLDNDMKIKDGDNYHVPEILYFSI